MRQHLRQDHILELVDNQGFVSIDELVESLRVTPQTIRRDLNQLAERNLISRHHGGAGPLESSTENTSYTTRVRYGSKAKQRIAARVVQDIPDGASIFVNIGTTTEAVARELLQRKNLSVITNNLHVAANTCSLRLTGKATHRRSPCAGHTRRCIDIYQYRHNN